MPSVAHSSRLSDGRDAIKATYFRGLDFVVNIDARLIRLQRAIGSKTVWSLPHPDALEIDDVMNADLLGYCHLMDVSGDRPESFRFDVFGSSISIERGHDYRGGTLGDFGISLLSQMAMQDYTRVRDERLPDVSQIDAQLGGRVVRYRRLIVPFSRDGRKVSDLLVAVTPNFVEI